LHRVWLWEALGLVPESAPNPADFPATYPHHEIAIASAICFHKSMKKSEKLIPRLYRISQNDDKLVKKKAKK
jgi:hypothetical protein